jgi:hypothetical protein
VAAYHERYGFAGERPLTLVHEEEISPTTYRPCSCLRPIDPGGDTGPVCGSGAVNSSRRAHEHVGWDLLSEDNGRKREKQRHYRQQGQDFHFDHWLLLKKQ